MARTLDRTMIQTGWDVYASDGEHIGTVDEVGDDYVLVQKGLIFPRDLYIPITSITRTEDNSLWLDVAKSDVDTRDWNEPPVMGRDTHRIQVHEEELDAQKTARKAGEVEVRKNVIEQEQSIDVPVTREDVVVRRKAVDRPATDAEASFNEGQTSFRVPVIEEDVSVSKHPRVKEEIEIDKVARQETERVGGTVRREQVEVTGEHQDD